MFPDIKKVLTEESFVEYQTLETFQRECLLYSKKCIVQVLHTISISPPDLKLLKN
jgi:hypothetical protein